MRHRKKLNHLGRTSSHRKAMLANMASSLILHKRITTTVEKAKALRIYVEPLLTRAKDDSTHSRRTVFSYLKNKFAVSELFREVSPKIADRPGGYTRILKTGNRLGDNANMCIIELVDYNENMLAETREEKPAARRRRRGRGKKTEDTGAKAVASAPEAVAEKDKKAEGTEEVKTEDTAAAEETKEAPKGEKEQGVEVEKERDDDTEKEQSDDVEKEQGDGVADTSGKSSKEEPAEKEKDQPEMKKDETATGDEEKDESASGKSSKEEAAEKEKDQPEMKKDETATGDEGKDETDSGKGNEPSDEEK